MIEIKKSKFLGFAYKVENVEDVEKYINNLKTEHKKAKHICYAYIIKNPHQEKFFDDGEPSGTAGRPILNVLQKQNKENILVCVVRYFGGIKLGAGGLLRAYTKCASETLKQNNL